MMETVVGWRTKDNHLLRVLRPAKATLGGRRLLCMLAAVPLEVSRYRVRTQAKPERKNLPLSFPNRQWAGQKGTNHRLQWTWTTRRVGVVTRRTRHPRAMPSPAKASQPEAQGGFMDTMLISGVWERDRDIPDDEYSPTNVCIFPESWEGAMTPSVTTAPRSFEQFRNELMGTGFPCIGGPGRGQPG